MGAEFSPARQAQLDAMEAAAEAPSAPRNLWVHEPQISQGGDSARQWVLHLLRQLRPMLEPPAGAAGVPPAYAHARKCYTRLLQSVNFAAGNGDPYAAANLGFALPLSTAATPAAEGLRSPPQPQQLARGPQMALFNSAW